MQSQVFALPALLFGVSYYFTTHDKGLLHKRNRTTSAVLLAAIVALLIGYSRSLWIGAAAGILTIAAFHLRSIKELIRLWKVTEKGVILTAIAVATIAFVTFVPIPSLPSMSDAGAVTNRIGTSDAAASSRWELLDAMREGIHQHPIAGSGFGATLSYKTSDPRVLATNPDGLYTTYAFEWGWLDHWFKLGILGLLAIALLLIRISFRILTSDAAPWMRTAAFASIVALAVTHIFTPYINHPLGLGYLLLIEGWLEVNKKQA
jgi:hypothetical protein